MPTKTILLRTLARLLALSAAPTAAADDERVCACGSIFGLDEER